MSTRQNILAKCACAAFLCASLVMATNNVNADIVFGITGGLGGANANFNLMHGEMDEGRFRAGPFFTDGTPSTGLTHTMSFGVYMTGYDSFSITSYGNFSLDNLLAGLGLTDNTGNGFTGSVADFGNLMDTDGYLWFTGTWNLPGGAFAPSGWVSNMPNAFTFGLFNDPNDPYVIPEPATLAMIGLGLAGLGYARRRQILKATAA